jgi:hypothetical protein
MTAHVPVKSMNSLGFAKMIKINKCNNLYLGGPADAAWQ